MLWLTRLDPANTAVLIMWLAAACGAPAPPKLEELPPMTIIVTDAAPMEPDLESEPRTDPCTKTTSAAIRGIPVAMLVPCRPFDRMKDLADPL